MTTQPNLVPGLREIEWPRIAEAARLLRASSDPTAEVRRLVQELHALCLSDLPSALERSELLTELADRASPIPARVAARCARAHVLSVANRFDGALRVLDEARSLSHDAGDAVAAAHVDHNAVQPLARLGRLSEAVERAERAVDAFETAGDAVSAAKAHSNLAVIHRMRDDPRRALHHFDRAIPALGQMPAIAAQLESNRAEALLDIADFAGAERAFVRALEAFQRVEAAHAAGVVEGNLADLLGRQGRLDAALGHFERASDRLRASDATGDAARLEAERAEVLASIGLIGEARDVWREVIPVLDRAGLTRESARARIGLASVLVRMGRHEEAEAAARAAAEHLTRVDSRQGLARANRALAQVLLARDQFGPAETILRDTIAALAEAPADQAASILALCRLLIAKHEHPEASRWIELGARLADRLELPVLQAMFMHARARVCTAEGRDADARRWLSMAISQIERMRGGFMGDRARAAWLGDHIELYEDLARLELARGDEAGDRSAFSVFERSRARSLLDMVRGGVELAEQLVHTDRTSAESDHLERLAAKRAEVNALFSWLEQRTAQSDETSRAMTRLRGLEREIASIEGRLAATRRYSEIFGEPVTIERLQRKLDDRTGVISWFELDGAIGAFVVRSGGVACRRPAGPIEIVRGAGARLRFQIDRAVSSTARAGSPDLSPRLVDHAQRELRLLHEHLIEPIQPLLRGLDRIVAVPAGAVHGLPISALLGPEGYAIERFDVLLAPSASLYEVIAGSDARPLSAHRALVLGVGDDAAPRTREEARHVGSRLPGARVAIDAEATTSLLASCTPDSGVLHVSCHGVFPPGQPMQARIRLGDRWLSAREAYSLDLRGSAVILSCCEVGGSAQAAGGEVFGLSRALLAAGARSMVAGAWAAHDEATMDLFGAFYDRLLAPDATRGETGVGAALGAAQRQLLSRWKHPAFWAAFACIGAT